jgi:hypothetical protein
MTSWFRKIASSENDSNGNIGGDPGLLGDAWREFAQEDAAYTAPPELERRVLAAWEAHHGFTRMNDQPERRRGRPGMRRLWWAAGAVAGVLLLAAGLRSHLATPARSSPPPGAGTSVIRAYGELPRWPHRASTAGAVMTLAVDPALETETLQLVRVRMPRRALAAVGFVVGGPDADGFVEVDVVVGEDGLSRDVRRVALVQK